MSYTIGFLTGAAVAIGAATWASWALARQNPRGIAQPKNPPPPPRASDELPRPPRRAS